MIKRNERILGMAQLSMFTAIIVILAFTPMIGYIPLGITRVTIIHIPVILGSILLGPKKGAFLGFVFGLTSLIMNTLNPTATSFVFTPFGTIGSTQGNFSSLLICFIPRILVGIIPFWVNYFFEKRHWNKYIGYGFSAILGSMTNTILVMNMIYLFFSDSYAAATNKNVSILYDAILYVISFNGVLEAVVAALIVTPIAAALIVALKRKK